MINSGPRSLPQSRKTGVRVTRGQNFAYRFAYARAAETRAVDDLGQDYLVVQEKQGVFIFALCDGVSQSFYGDLASRFLGDALVAWLRDDLSLTMNRDAIRQSLTVHLQSLTEPATEQVQEHPLPQDVSSSLVRDVLEEKRELGSESMFVCGRIDLLNRDFPQGRLVLAWMGDSRLRLWDEAEERTAELKNSLETSQRWSSRRGIVGGEPNVFVSSLEYEGQHISRVMAYSDGLARLDRQCEDLTNSLLQDLIKQANTSADSDDIAFLEVWLGFVPSYVEKEPLPAPRLLEVGVRGGCIWAAWKPVRDIQRYEVKAEDGRTLQERSKTTKWESPEMEPGDYRVRVRADTDKGLSRWSEGQSVTVPEVPEVPAPPPAEAEEPRPSTFKSLSREFKIRMGCLAAVTAVVILIGGLAGLALPLNGPLREIIFGPTPTVTLASTPKPTITFTPMPALTATSTHTPTLTATRTPTAERTLTPTSTSMPSPIQTPTMTVVNTPISSTVNIVMPTEPLGSYPLATATAVPSPAATGQYKPTVTSEP